MQCHYLKTALIENLLLPFPFAGFSTELRSMIDYDQILQCTMGQNRKKHRMNSHLIIHCPTSSGVSEVSERAGE